MHCSIYAEMDFLGIFLIFFCYFAIALARNCRTCCMSHCCWSYCAAVCMQELCSKCADVGKFLNPDTRPFALCPLCRTELEIPFFMRLKHGKNYRVFE